MRIGFLVWNEFQFYHIRSVLRELPEATLFVDVRRGLRRRFPFHVLADLQNPIVRINGSRLSRISDLVDALVVQSRTSAREKNPNVHIVAIQYSLSKEWHQYKGWMEEADLVLCFGDYSKSRINTEAPVVAVGNPRMDDLFADRLDPLLLAKLRQDLDPNKHTLMFAPSWNDPEAIMQLRKFCHQISDKYNILWAPHHLTRIFKHSIISNIFKKHISFDKYIYYLKLSDVLISDTSGSLFDAIHVGKRVIIADFGSTDARRRDSIEFNMREYIGPVAYSPSELRVIAERVIEDSLDFSVVNADLRDRCFACEGNAAQKVVAAIQSLGK